MSTESETAELLSIKMTVQEPGMGEIENLSQSGPNVIKLFLSVIYEFSQLASVCSWQSFPAQSNVWR